MPGAFDIGPNKILSYKRREMVLSVHEKSRNVELTSMSRMQRLGTSTGSTRRMNNMGFPVLKFSRNRWCQALRILYFRSAVL